MSDALKGPTVLALIETFPYLGWSLAMFGLLGVLMLCSSAAQRRKALWSAALATPFAFLEQFAIPIYWNPKRTLVWLGVSPEDFLFVFTIGGLSWLLATWPLRQRLAVDTEPKGLLRRYTLVSGLAFPLSLGTLLLEVKPMSYTLVPIVVGGFVFVALRPALSLLAVPGMAGYTLVHCVVLKSAFALTPSFASSWNAPNLWGPTLWGIPVDEIIWAAAFGAVWPVFVAYVFNARFHFLDRLSRPALTQCRPPAE